MNVICNICPSAWTPSVSCQIIEVLCVLKSLVLLKTIFNRKGPCWNASPVKSSKKTNKILNTTFIRPSTPGVQKVKIYDTVWYLANFCCSFYYATKLQMALNPLPK